MIKYIYTFFIGLLLATFVGVGIAAFYESPKRPEYQIDQQLMDNLEKVSTPTQCTEELSKLREATLKQENSIREYEKTYQVYSRNVSIAASLFSIVILVISLTFLKKLHLISDGLLLGGLFTQFYSIIRGFASENVKYRFVVVTIGLIISLIIGYIKFIKDKKSK